MRDLKAATKPPVFIGGTGRSGTTITGKLMASHRDYCKLSGENKLIVERFGLRTLVDELSAGFDYKSNHYTIQNFIDYTEVMRKPGFRDKKLAFALRAFNKVARTVTGRQIPAQSLHRRFPSLDYTGFAFGHRFGLDHYDACLDRFLKTMIADVDIDGVIDSEGQTKPVYMPATFDRDALLQMCRTFLQELYTVRLEAAGAQGWCDDTPFSILYTPFLFELFPDARVIHMMRHPMDVFASHLEQPWASSDPERTALRLQRLYERLVADDVDKTDDRVMLLRLEDIPLDEEGTLKSICDFCSIPEDGFDGSVSFRKDSFWRWKRDLSEDIQKMALSRLSFAMDHYGYEA